MKRYKHSLTHFRHGSADMGKIIPIGCVPVIRGDTFRHNTNIFMRLEALVKPIMHPVHVYIQHTYIPYRLLWDDWQNFITGGEDFDDASQMPTITFDGAGSNPSPVTVGSLPHHMGLPVGFNGTVNALKYRAYALYYNELGRDDQLQDKVGFSSAAGADTTTNTDILNCNWAKDPFVSARPDDQLGAEVTLPLGTEAPVRGIAVPATWSATGPGTLYESGGNDVSYSDSDGNRYDAAYARQDPDALGYPNVYADLTNATAATINELRLAIATQQWQERINIAGNTYSDYLRRYGIRYSDARIDRPEYIAGGKQTVQFSEVIQTAEGTDPVGDLKGHGIAALRSNNYMKTFEEDGFVLTTMMVKPIPMYMQAVPREDLKMTKEEFFQKEYVILGMQEITNQEVYYAHSSPTGTFGYQPRFDEYRRIPNTVHGEFGDPSNTEGISYHMARIFSSDPALNSSFVTCNPTNRIFAATTPDQLKFTCQHRLVARRLVPKKAGYSGLNLNM